jgi:hypothetical protein
MIPERYRVLLTAYVDGELSGRQRRHVVKLLRRSREARLLLRELQSDSQVLRTMARPKTPLPDITLPVMQTIAERRLRPGSQGSISLPALDSGNPPRWGVPAWAALLAVAATLMIVTLSSYLFFRSHFAPKAKPSDDAPTVRVPPAETPAPDEKPIAPVPIVPPVANQSAPKNRPDAPIDRPATPPSIARDKPGEINASPSPTETKDPNEPSGPVFTSPRDEIFKFEEVQVGTNVILGMSDLDKEAELKKLTEAGHKEKALRVELPCRNGSQALLKLQTAWKAQHANLVVEAISQARLKKPELKTNYLLYINDIQPEELSELLKQVGGEDHKAKAAEQQFTAVVVRGMTKQDHKELTDLLGYEPSPVPPMGTGPLGTDPRRSLADDTAAQLVRTMDGPRPEPGKPAVKMAEYQTLALAWTPVRPPKGAIDIKHFMDGRKPSRAGSIEVLLVLRSKE